VQRLLIEHFSHRDQLISTEQARELGLTKRQLDGLVERGELERMHRGVYRNRSVPIDQRQRLVAGLLACGPDAVVSHRSALWLHGAPNVSGRIVELTNRSSSLPLHRGLLLHRSATLGPPDVTRVDRLWSTTRERTLIDCCVVVPIRIVLRIAEHWLANRLTTLDHIHGTIERLPFQPGARQLARGLTGRSLGAVVADSPLEHRLGELLEHAGLPAVHHVVVTVSSGRIYEIDWAFPNERLGIEVDGYGVHLRSVNAFDDDRWRRNELENEGWQILNFTSGHLRRSPGRVVGQVRQALTRRLRDAERPEVDTLRSRVDPPVELQPRSGPSSTRRREGN
jgi:hypothetical protein